jgi:hypothetical protein
VIRSGSWLVPGHQMWRARPMRRGGRTIAIRARHRLLRWHAITVDTRDLRYGAEAVARYLSGGNGGFIVRDTRDANASLVRRLILR